MSWKLLPQRERERDASTTKKCETCLGTRGNKHLQIHACLSPRWEGSWEVSNPYTVRPRSSTTRTREWLTERKALLLLRLWPHSRGLSWSVLA